MFKKLQKTLALLMVVALMAACGAKEPAETPVTPDPVTPDAETPVEEEPADVEIDRSEELIIYTNANSDGRGEWLEAEAKSAGYNITIVGGGGANIASRLISEKTNPVADIVYGLNSMFYEQLKNEEALLNFIPEWSGEVEKSINDPDGYYHGLVKQALLLSYNPEKFTADTAPKSYVDLANMEAFAGKYESPNKLDQATPRLILSSILVQFKDETGDLGISQEGWDTLKKFLDNGVVTPEGEDFYSLLASGDTPIGTLVSGTLQAKADQYGVTSEFVSPEDVGSPLIVEHVAIINGTKQEDLAKDFVNWIGSSEVQGKFASEFNAMPANEVAAEQATDYVKELYKKITTQELDWAFISEYIDRWMEKIELELL